MRSLARGGRLVTCGATTGAKGTLDLQALFGKQLTIHGSYMGTKGELLRAAQFFFAGQLKPVIDRTFPLADAAAAQQPAGRVGAVRQDRARSLMQYQRIGLSLFTLVAVVSIVLAAATIWLFVTNPVTVANAVNEGEVSPLVRNLAEVLYDALAGFSNTCDSPAEARTLQERSVLPASQADPNATELRYVSAFRRRPEQRPLQEPRQHPPVDELERRLSGAVVAAAQHRDLVRDAEIAEFAARDPRTDRPGTSDRSARRRAASADREGARDTTAG